MKLKTLLFAAISLSFFHNIAVAQSDTTFYDRMGERTDRLENCDFYSVIRKNSEGHTELKKYYRNHQLKFTCPVSVEGEPVPLYDGYAVAYYENGKKSSEGMYKEGKKEGEWKFYYEETGKLQEQSNYTNDFLNGELQTYYKNGRKRREENFENGISTGGTCFDESGEQIPFIPYEVMPEFPGGMALVPEFLSKNIHYPNKARYKNIQGKVIVRFTVKKDGSLDYFYIVKGIGYGCDEEVIRVIKLMPKWTPGEREGEKVDVYYRLPVSFRLE